MRAIMQRTALLALAGLLIVALGAAAAQTSQPNNRPNSNLQYFGYYHMDGYQNPDPKYLPFVGGLENSNVAIFSSWARGTTLQNHINLADSNGMKVLLNVYDFFFQWSPGGMGDGSGALHNDWELYYSGLKDTLAGYEDKLLGFYFDEPWWCGVSEADFRMVTALLRQDFPDHKVVSISAVADLDMQNTGYEMSSDYIEFVTDVGFDYYGDDLATGQHGLLLSALKLKADRGQDIWLVPRGFSRNAAETPFVLQNHLLHYYKLALQEPRVVGIVPFTMPTGGDWSTGLYEFMNPASAKYDPYLAQAHVQVGKSVLSRSHGELFISSANTGNNASAWSGDGEALLWTAPKAGSIQISTNGRMSRTNVHENNLSINVKHGSGIIWPSPAGWQPVTAANADQLLVRAEAEVEAGDVIRFDISGWSAAGSDTISWDPVVLYTEAEEPGTEEPGTGEPPVEEPLYTISSSFKVGETNNAQALAGGELLVSHVQVKNNQETPQTVTVIVGLYDATGSDGALVSVSYTTLELASGATGEFRGGFKLPEQVGGYTAKAFVIQGDNLQAPGQILADVASIAAP